MYAKVALLLLSFAVAAYGETCTCGGLKACVDQKNNVDQRSQDKCTFQCRKKLPGNAAKIQQCIEDKQNALKKLNDKQVDCLLNPAKGACVAPRARRQSDPNNFFVQLSASDFQPESNRGKWIQAGSQAQPESNNFFEQLGASDFQSESNRGKWIQAGAEAQPEANINTGISADELLQPYNDCVDSCLQEMRQQKGEGLASGQTTQAVDPMGRHLAVIQECQLTEKCTLNLPELAKAAQTSCQSGSTDVLNFDRDIKKSFCRCVRGVSQKSDSEMPC